MIYVDRNQLRQVEYLIAQSLQGNHVLFDSETVRRILGCELPVSETEAFAVEHHIERLILKTSLDEKRAYLEGLDGETYERVVRTYFNIVENNLFESDEARH